MLPPLPSLYPINKKIVKIAHDMSQLKGVQPSLASPSLFFFLPPSSSYLSSSFLPFPPYSFPSHLSLSPFLTFTISLLYRYFPSSFFLPPSPPSFYIFDSFIPIRPSLPSFSSFLPSFLPSLYFIISILFLSLLPSPLYLFISLTPYISISPYKSISLYL